jgi:hypothetical protein
MTFMTDLLEVTVADHDSHYHNHSHTHTFGTHTHDYDHYHPHAHTHVTDDDTQTHAHTTGAHTHVTDDHTHSGHDGYESANTHNHTTDEQSNSYTEGTEIIHNHNTISQSAANTDSPNTPTTDAAAGASGDADPVKTSDDISNGTTNSNREHTVLLPTITYCSQSSQEAMANMSTTTPKVKTKDGVAMDPQWGNTKYHELDEYGTVYLVWQVDIEQGGSEVIACWVQVGEPEDTSTVGNINSGNTTTNRRNTGTPHDGTGEPEDGDADVENDDKGIFFIELGTVAENDHVTQLVASDVNWTSTVMDRVVTTALNETPTGTYTP